MSVTLERKEPHCVRRPSSHGLRGPLARSVRGSAVVDLIRFTYDVVLVSVDHGGREVRVRTDHSAHAFGAACLSEARRGAEQASCMMHVMVIIHIVKSRCERGRRDFLLLFYGFYAAALSRRTVRRVVSLERPRASAHEDEPRPAAARVIDLRETHTDAQTLAHSLTLSISQQLVELHIPRGCTTVNCVKTTTQLLPLSGPLAD